MPGSASQDRAISDPDNGSSPRHVAIIMDGNGRWATQHGLPRLEGHRRGVEALRRAVRAAIDLNIGYLTVYSFSAENWARPFDEVQSLLGLLHLFIRNDLAELNANNVRVRIIGERQGLARDIAQLLIEAETVTKNNTGLVLVVAFNYGARQEIAAAARRLAQQVAAVAVVRCDLRHGEIRLVEACAGGVHADENLGDGFDVEVFCEIDDADVIVDDLLQSLERAEDRAAGGDDRRGPQAVCGDAGQAGDPATISDERVLRAFERC